MILYNYLYRTASTREEQQDFSLVFPGEQSGSVLWLGQQWATQFCWAALGYQCSCILMHTCNYAPFPEGVSELPWDEPLVLYESGGGGGGGGATAPLSSAYVILQM